ncbi:hypothetical protein H5410_020878 [Solanum commersonii]|uniref:Uncharacterized protein n=1 Tax=Solanum commersonii TaxID=4109 RepID=A0A9J5ZB58_SOLCO|nr:hypothetical protein H5410_020878 [Solanum commersonii]
MVFSCDVVVLCLLACGGCFRVVLQWVMAWAQSRGFGCRFRWLLGGIVGGEALVLVDCSGGRRRGGVLVHATSIIRRLQQLRNISLLLYSIRAIEFNSIKVTF